MLENERRAIAPAGSDDDLVAELTTVLVRTLRALGQAGQPDRALPLAASAWSLLRHRDAEQAERVNGAMHYLARRPESAPVAGHQAPVAGHHAPVAGHQAPAGGQHDPPAGRAPSSGPAV